MKRNILSEILLYKYRYIIGYSLFALLLVGALILSFNIPGQISFAEQKSAVTSATISLVNPSAEDIVDLPYHLLQKASLHYFEITNLGIKLPSMTFAALSAIGLLWLLRRWLLRDSIALLTIFIFIASRTFLFTSQDGTPLIMMLFWLVFILLFALKFTANNKSLFWGSLLTTSLVLSLYTPLGIYVVVCLLAASILHPHLRHTVSSLPKSNLVLFTVLGLLLVSPLAIATIKNPTILGILAGWPSADTTLETLVFNIKELTRSFFFFWSPGLTAIGLAPVLSASSFVLVILGILNLIKDHHSARSYMLIMTLPVVALPSLFNPDFLIILAVPMILLLGLGIESLLDEWYSLFPHNPYARVVALVPMIILLSGLMVGNLFAYVNSYTYSPSLNKYYNRDLLLVRQILQARPNSTLLVNEGELAFYKLLARDFSGIVVSSKPEDVANSKTAIVHTSNNGTQFGKLNGLVTDGYKNGGVRFYIYQK